jgi:hypothetical protein
MIMSHGQLLMRLVDDYLFVSPERAKAENFARMMAQGTHGFVNYNSA